MPGFQVESYELLQSCNHPARSDCSLHGTSPGRAARPPGFCQMHFRQTWKDASSTFRVSLGLLVILHFGLQVALLTQEADSACNSLGSTASGHLCPSQKALGLLNSIVDARPARFLNQFLDTLPESTPHGLLLAFCILRSLSSLSSCAGPFSGGGGVVFAQVQRPPASSSSIIVAPSWAGTTTACTWTCS